MTDALIAASAEQRRAMRRADNYQPRVTAYQRQLELAFREWREARQHLAMCGGPYLYSGRLSEHEDDMHAAYGAAMAAIRRAKQIRDGGR